MKQLCNFFSSQWKIKEKWNVHFSFITLKDKSNITEPENECIFKGHNMFCNNDCIMFCRYSKNKYTICCSDENFHKNKPTYDNKNYKIFILQNSKYCFCFFINKSFNLHTIWIFIVTRELFSAFRFCTQIYFVKTTSSKWIRKTAQFRMDKIEPHCFYRRI